MTINDSKLFVEYLSNKFASGAFTALQFNLAAERAQIQVCNEAFRKWQATQEITDELGAILTNKTLQVPVTGILPYPDDYMHLSSFRHVYYSGNTTLTAEPQEVEIKEIDNGAWGKRISSALRKPTLRFPVCTLYDTYIDVRPRNIGAVKMDYFRVPKKPVWGFNVVNGRPVYDPTKSTDFELLDQTHNLICFHICSYLGINLSFPQLQQYANQMIAGVTNSNQ